MLFQSNLANMFFLATIFLLLFASAEILYRKYKIKAEITRKYVHLLTGLLSLSFPILLTNHWYLLCLCGSFLLILITSMKFGLLPSINAVDRVTRGSLLYPVIVYGLFLIQNYYGIFVFYYVPILILAICDPVAGLTGKKWQYGKFTIFGKTKTLIGSSGFFISSFLTVVLYFVFSVRGITFNLFILSTITALLTTLAEAVTHKGYDNLTIPATALLTLIAGKEFFFLF